MSDAKFTKLVEFLETVAEGGEDDIEQCVSKAFDNEQKREFLAIKELFTTGKHQQTCYLRRILNSITCGILVNDINGMITFSNDAHNAMVNLPDEEIEEVGIWDMQLEGGMSNDEIQEYLRQIVAVQPPPEPYFSKNLTKTHEVIDVCVNWNYLRDKTGRLIGLVSVISDITEQNRIDEALRDSEKKYRTLTSMLPVGIFYADIDGKNQFVNQRLVNLRNVPEKRLLGERWVGLVHHEDRKLIYKNWRKAIENKTEYSAQYRSKLLDGTIRWSLTEMMPDKDDEGNVRGFFGTVTDITRLHEAEAKLRQHQSELGYYLRLDAAGQMISNITHELKQPLAAIIHYTGGCLRRLKDEPVNGEIIGVMQRVIVQAERAGAVIGRLKDFLHRGEPQRSVVNIHQLIREALELIKFRLFSEKIEVHLDFVRNLPEVLMSKIQFEQVMLNLINNAVDAMQKTANRKLTISTFLTSNDELEIIVADTGGGISEYVLENLFKPFVTTKAQGMGVGLSASKAIVEQYNGSINVTSIPNHGTQMHLRFPMKELIVE